VAVIINIDTEVCHQGSVYLYFIILDCKSFPFSPLLSVGIFDEPSPMGNEFILMGCFFDHEFFLNFNCCNFFSSLILLLLHHTVKLKANKENSRIKNYVILGRLFVFCFVSFY
jgi:hypothetical protein